MKYWFSENKNIRLYNGDCLEVMDKLIENNVKVDAIICDLPYQITSNKWDIIVPFEEMWGRVHKILKENGVSCFTASQPFTSALVMSNVKEYKHEWIWLKNRGSNFANTVREPMKEHESVLVFSKGKWTYNKQMQERTGGGLERSKYEVTWDSKSDNYNDFEGRKNNKISKLRVPSSWQKFNVEVGHHPTQKPTKLMEYLVKTYTNEGDTVLDFTMGSGTTGVACKNLNRKFIGIELDEKYFDIAVKRLNGEL